MRGDSRDMPEESDLPIKTVDDFGRFALAELGLDGGREELIQLGAWFAELRPLLQCCEVPTLL